MIELRDNKIKCLLVKPNELPEEIEIENTLEATQKLVGGYIECVRLPNDDSIVLICNEEGKINDMEWNRGIGDDVIVGPFLIVGNDYEDCSFRSLTPEQISDYKMKFGDESIFRTMHQIKTIRFMSDMNINIRKKNRIQEIYSDASKFLQDNIEHQNKKIDYILINPSNNDLWVMCSDGVDTAIELHYRDGMMKNNYIPEWDFNFDYYVFNLLEDGFKIGYMSNNLHHSLWNSIHELYPNDIEFKTGVKNYIYYCKNNNINKKYLDEKTNLDTPDVMKMFKNNERER